MNIFIKEFKSYLLPLIIWVVALVTVHGVASIEFDVFQGDESIAAAMEQFESLFQALGTSPQDITTPAGFLSILSIYISLPLAIYSGLLGSGIISKEEKNKTAEFLFTLPVSRRKVLFNKLYVAITNSVLINVLLMGSIVILYGRFNPDKDFYIFLRNIAIGTLILQLIFLSIGVALSSVLKYYKKSGSLTVIVLTSSFLLNILLGFVEDLDFLKYISPFNYYTPDLMMAGNFEPVFLILSVLIVASGIFSLFYFYPKRDLYI